MVFWMENLAFPVRLAGFVDKRATDLVQKTPYVAEEADTEFTLLHEVCNFPPKKRQTRACDRIACKQALLQGLFTMIW